MFQPILLASYNTRWACAADGTVDTSRIAQAISANGTPDVICLQEVSVGHTGLEGTENGPNQVAQYLEHFPDYHSFFAPSMSKTIQGKPAHFGNLTLTRLPVQQVRYHSLPSPEPEVGVTGLPRNMIATTLVLDELKFTVLNTHLEYHSQRQRLAQIEFIKEFCDNIQRTANPTLLPQAANEEPTTIFTSEASEGPLVLCGDLNCQPESEELMRLCNGVEGLPSTLNNVWSVLDKPSASVHTVGLHAEFDWPGHAYCCDYFIMSESLMPNLVEAWVDQGPNASDHQPIFMRLNANLTEAPPVFL